jgi:hypothetical protein
MGIFFRGARGIGRLAGAGSGAGTGRGGAVDDDGPEWAYRFLVVDVEAGADAIEQTAAINRAWERIAENLWTPEIVSFETVVAGDYLSLVICYRYDDSDDEEYEDEEEE